MPLVSTASIVDPAHRNGEGVAAFNVITLEHAEAIAAGAERTGQPAILQISENAVRFHHGRLRPLAAAVVGVASDSTALLSVHLDHVEDAALLHQVAGTGISSVMFDASKLDYQANVAATREAALWAHEHEIWIEAELGEIGGKDGVHAPGVRTDPAEASRFVADTGVDALAVAVGSSHAMTSRTAQIDLGLVAAIRATVPVPLVLHGSSGVPDADLVGAVEAGMTKVNVATHLNAVFTTAVRDHLRADPAVVDTRRYLGAGRAAVEDETIRLMSMLDRR